MSPILLIPAYNAAPHLDRVVRGARDWGPVLVVDDGSEDGTAAVARNAGAHVIRHDVNQGKGAALRTGFRWALIAGAEAVVMLDADGQHDPADIGVFLDQWSRTGADLIVGQRNFRQMPLARRLGNRLSAVLFRWAIGAPVPDNQCGYRLLTPAACRLSLGSSECGFEFEAEMIARALAAGQHVEWVPIRTLYGDQGSHIRIRRHMHGFVRLMWRLWRAG